METRMFPEGKTEEEATELNNKAKTLEVEVNVFGEKLSVSEMQQKAKEAQVQTAEAEFNQLNSRRSRSRWS